MSNSTLQDIVACLVHRASGNPNQYVTERAFSKAKLDYRYLTLEVKPEELRAAVLGAQALGFAGLWLDPPYDEVAAQFMADSPGDDAKLGMVDVISWRESQPVAICTWGQAVVKLAKEMNPTMLTEAVVWGSGPAAVATAVAMSRDIFSPVTLVAKGAGETERVKALISTVNADVQVVEVGDAGRIRDHFAAIVLGDDPQTDRDPLPNYDVDDLCPETAVVELYPHKEVPEFIDKAQMQASAAIDNIHILIERLATAFRLWTGKDPDLREMRESLEEFWMV